jgi:hypothetical protein
MHPLAMVHYLNEKDKDQPAHWSGPAERYVDGVDKMNRDMTRAINEAPAPLREILAALHAEVLQLRRMVSEGVILAMVRDEFWKQYDQVPIQVEDFVNITEATIQLFERLFNEGLIKANPEIRATLNEAVARTREARQRLIA